MSNTIQGIIFLLLGCGILIASKQGARRAIKFWKLPFSKNTENRYRIVYIFVGISFIVLGILAVLQIITFK